MLGGLLALTCCTFNDLSALWVSSVLMYISLFVPFPSRDDADILLFAVLSSLLYFFTSLSSLRSAGLRTHTTFRVVPPLYSYCVYVFLFCERSEWRIKRLERDVLRLLLGMEVILYTSLPCFEEQKRIVELIVPQSDDPTTCFDVGIE